MSAQNFSWAFSSPLEQIQASSSSTGTILLPLASASPSLIYYTTFLLDMLGSSSHNVSIVPILYLLCSYKGRFLHLTQVSQQQQALTRPPKVVLRIQPPPIYCCMLSVCLYMYVCVPCVPVHVFKADLPTSPILLLIHLLLWSKSSSNSSNKLGLLLCQNSYIYSSIFLECFLQISQLLTLSH